jgi:hypothetical protein
MPFPATTPEPLTAPVPETLAAKTLLDRAKTKRPIVNVDFNF